MCNASFFIGHWNKNSVSEQKNVEFEKQGTYKFVREALYVRRWYFRGVSKLGMASSVVEVTWV